MKNGISSTNPIRSRIAAKGAAGAEPDQRPAGRECAEYADLQQEAYCRQDRKAGALGSRECELSEHGKEHRCRSRQLVCEARRGERWTAHETDSSGADGARLSLRAADCAHRDCACRAREKWRRRSGDGCWRRESRACSGEEEARGSEEEIGRQKGSEEVISD